MWFRILLAKGQFRGSLSSCQGNPTSRSSVTVSDASLWAEASLRQPLAFCRAEGAMPEGQGWAVRAEVREGFWVRSLQEDKTPISLLWVLATCS